MSDPEYQEFGSVDEPADSGSVKVSKICITCGKDTSGHRRVKDSRGYQCYACAKKEIRQEWEGTIKCPQCSRRVRELQFYNGQKICGTCFAHNKEQDKRAKKVETVHHERHDRKKLIAMIAIFVLLLLIVILNQLDII